jgi:hypothetical protein
VYLILNTPFFILLAAGSSKTRTGLFSHCQLPSVVSRYPTRRHHRQYPTPPSSPTPATTTSLPEQSQAVSRFLTDLSPDAHLLLNAFIASGCDSESNLHALAHMSPSRIENWIEKMSSLSSEPVSALTIELIKDGLERL